MIINLSSKKILTPPVLTEKESISPVLLERNTLISVIISLYNYEKYIGECLESLLGQTFQSFEIIVVDDCSTDNSIAIIKSYFSKFNGRLRLTKTKVNTGGGGEPRNLGFRFSIGKYVFFMDADDALVKTGLEEMYTLAEKYDADVVWVLTKNLLKMLVFQ